MIIHTRKNIHKGRKYVCLSSRSRSSLQVSSLVLLALNGLKQTLEVSSPESIKVIALDNLDEDSWSVHQWLGEELQQVSTLVKINQDIESLNRLKVLDKHTGALGEPLLHGCVVGLGNRDEFNATGLHVGDGGDDVCCFERNVLYTRAIVEFNVLLDL